MAASRIVHMRKLANTRWVEFLASNSNALTYFEQGVILRFAQGYTHSQIKKIKINRAKNGYAYEIIENILRTRKKMAPLRNLDTEDYALVLVFDEVVDDYLLKWVKVSDLSIRSYTISDYPQEVLVPREEGVIRQYAVGFRVEQRLSK